MQEADNIFRSMDYSLILVGIVPSCIRDFGYLGLERLTFKA